MFATFSERWLPSAEVVRWWSGAEIMNYPSLKGLVKLSTSPSSLEKLATKMGLFVAYK